MSDSSRQPQRYCTNCGAEVRPKTQFCVSCGVAFDSETEAYASGREPAGASHTVQANRRMQTGGFDLLEQDGSRDHGARNNSRTGPIEVVPSQGALGWIKKVAGENKVVTISLTALTILVTAVGAISDFSGLFGLWVDNEKSNARPYVGVEVKNYAPQLVAFAFACEKDNKECNREAREAERNEELKQQLQERGAVRVVNVVQNGPAANAGIRPDDVITDFDGYNVSGAAEFSRIMDEHHPGDIVRLSLYRKDQDKLLQRKSIRMELEE